MKLKFGKRMLSFLLVLAMLVGFMPDIVSETELSANAAAPTITQGVYIRMGSYNGRDVDWFCARVNNTGIMMLSKYVIKTSRFGSNATYKTSDIHKWLDLDSGGTFATDLGLSKAELSLVRTVDLSGSNGDGTDSFIIPSYGNNEQNKGTPYTKAGFLDNPTSICSIYWLRTPRDASNVRVVKSVDDTVAARYSGAGYGGRGIRPMFYLDANSLKDLAYTGTGTEADPYVFESRYSINSDLTTGGKFSVTAARDGIDAYNGEWQGSQNNKLVKNAVVTLTPQPTTGFRLGKISAAKRLGSDVDAPFTPLSGTDGMNGEKFTNLVDKNTETKWCLNFTSSDPPYIIIRANNMMTMKSYSLTTANDTLGYSGRNWKDWTIYGANFSSDAEAVKDSRKWEVVTSVTNDSKLQAINYTRYDYTVNATTPYQYYMLKVTANQGADLIQMSEFNLRGDAFETIPLTQTNGNYSFTMPEANVEINADFWGDLYFVKKNVNDTWEIQDADQTTFTGTSYQVTEETANKYCADHYVFKGYSTAYSADNVKYTDASAGQNLTSNNGKLYLYYELPRYDLTLYQDIEGTKTYRTDSLPDGKPLDSYANETPAAQAHDTFAGWSESTNQSAYSDSALVNWSGQTMKAAKNVYPIWVHDKVNVKLNQGYGNTATESSSFSDLDSTLTLTTPTRDGYDFDSWYTQNGTKWDNSWSITPEFCDKNAEGTAVVQTDSNQKYDYYTLTLTAHWKPKTVQIVYSLGDHAADGSQTPANGSVEMDGTATLADAPTPNNDYLFTGWKNGDSLYSAGGSFTLDNWSIVSDNKITLTAQYEEKTRVNLLFDTAGGTAIAPIVEHAGNSISLSDYTTSRTGHMFANWSDGTNTYGSSDSYIVPDNGSTYVTLTANWTVNQYTITFDSLGGSSVGAITQNYGTSITTPAAPTRAHYTFEGWYPALPGTMPAENITLNAIWKPIEYTITFRDGDSTYAAPKGVYGTAVNAPEKPTKEGYDFDGWRDSSNNPVTFPIYISGDATYTAAWKKKISYTVTFKVVGGQWNDHTTVDKTVTMNGYEDDVLKLTAENIPAVGNVPDALYKAGDWDTVPDTETQITETKTYTYTYAQKAQISATITFKVVNGSWNDETKADKIVTLSGYEGDVLKLTAANIPEVGEKPDANCSDGGWDVMPDTEVEITENKCYTYCYERMAVITKAPAAKTLTYNKNAQELVTAGVADGGTIWYCISESSPEESASPESTIWCTQVPRETNAGKYKVWYIAVGDEGYVDTEIDSIEVNIEKRSPVAKYPTAKNQTYYSGTVQLINAGTVEDDCTIEYALGTDATTAPTNGWETDATKITANKSGNFYVWYKVTGTKNYEGVDATPITVKVSQGSTYSSQTWTLTMDSYEYDGTAHTPTINGKAYTYSYTQVQYTYYNADTNEELDGAPSAIGNYKVKVYADGGSNYYSRTQYATYSITDPIDANGMAKVDAFKENDTTPVSDGKIFAGWFKDETCTTAYTEDSGKAYAKFIDEKILTVKAQISSGTTANSASTSIRFITSFDSLKYQNVGFKITFNGKTIDKQMTKVYTALNANGKKISPKVFSEDSNYMEAYTLNNIPQSAFGKEFTVTPYFTTQDGTIVEGKTNTFTIANMIK